MAAEPTATIRLFWPFVELANELNPHGVFMAWQESRLDDRVRDAEARVPHSVLNKLLLVGADFLGCADFGLLAAERVKPGDLDLLELVARSRANLGECVACMPRLLPLLHDAAEMTVTPVAGRMEVRFGFASEVSLAPPGYDFLMALAMISSRRVVGRPGLRTEEVWFPYPARDDLSVYERIFDCPLRFDQPHAGLHFSVEALELPLVHASPTVTAALERVATELLAAGHSPADFHTRVVSAIGDLLSSGNECSAASVAKKLGVSLRTLQRRLGDDETTFRAVLDEHRAHLARAYLAREDLSLAEIAYLLGFSTSQAFHKAFKRWSDCTPAEYRAASVAPPPRAGGQR